MNGGYFMIDCKGVDLLVQSGQTIEGLYDDVSAGFKSGKPVYAYNCMWGTNKMTPVPVMVNPDPDTDDQFVITSSVLQIRVDADDAVTVSVLS